MPRQEPPVAMLASSPTVVHNPFLTPHKSMHVGLKGPRERRLLWSLFHHGHASLQRSDLLTIQCSNVLAYAQTALLRRGIAGTRPCHSACRPNRSEKASPRYGIR